MIIINSILGAYVICAILFFAVCIHAAVTDEKVRMIGALHPRHVSAIVVLVAIFVSAIWPVAIYIAHMDRR